MDARNMETDTVEGSGFLEERDSIYRIPYIDLKYCTYYVQIIEIVQLVR